MLAETEFDEAIAAEETRLAELNRLTDTARTHRAELRMARGQAAARDAETERATDAGQHAGTAWKQGSLFITGEVVKLGRQRRQALFGAPLVRKLSAAREHARSRERSGSRQRPLMVPKKWVGRLHREAVA